MSNPRKFSEKIAIHQQKQAQQEMEFNDVMRDLKSVVARQVCWPSLQVFICGFISVAYGKYQSVRCFSGSQSKIVLRSVISILAIKQHALGLSPPCQYFPGRPFITINNWSEGVISSILFYLGCYADCHHANGDVQRWFITKLSKPSSKSRFRKQTSAGE